MYSGETADPGGSFPSSIAGYRDGKSREILYALVRAGLLVEDKSRRIFRLGFPLDIVERWFPKLYPVT
jgi:hypothetical protein